MCGLSRRGASHGSSVSRPSAQKRRSIASHAAGPSARNQPGHCMVAVISGSTNPQSAAVKAGGACLCTASTCLRRPRPRARQSRTRSGGRRDHDPSAGESPRLRHVRGCEKRSGGRSRSAHDGTGVNGSTPGAATMAAARRRRPSSSVASRLAVGPPDIADAPVLHGDPLRRAKPVSVVDEDVERDRIDLVGCTPGLIQICGAPSSWRLRPGTLPAPATPVRRLPGGAAAVPGERRRPAGAPRPRRGRAPGLRSLGHHVHAPAVLGRRPGLGHRDDCMGTQRTRRAGPAGAGRTRVGPS
jgi:hypothetical protein